MKQYPVTKQYNKNFSSNRYSNDVTNSIIKVSGINQYHNVKNTNCNYFNKPSFSCGISNYNKNKKNSKSKTHTRKSQVFYNNSNNNNIKIQKKNSNIYHPYNNIQNEFCYDVTMNTLNQNNFLVKNNNNAKNNNNNKKDPLFLYSDNINKFTTNFNTSINDIKNYAKNLTPEPMPVKITKNYRSATMTNFTRSTVSNIVSDVSTEKKRDTTISQDDNKSEDQKFSNNLKKYILKNSNYKKNNKNIYKNPNDNYNDLFKETNSNNNEMLNSNYTNRNQCDKILSFVLKNLGLENLCMTFVNNRINFYDLFLLSRQDFFEMKIPIGPRNRILHFIFEYKQIAKNYDMEELIKFFANKNLNSSKNSFNEMSALSSNSKSNNRDVNLKAYSNKINNLKSDLPFSNFSEYKKYYVDDSIMKEISKEKDNEKRNLGKNYSSTAINFNVEQNDTNTTTSTVNNKMNSNKFFQKYNDLFCEIEKFSSRYKQMKERAKNRNEEISILLNKRGKSKV